MYAVGAAMRVSPVSGCRGNARDTHAVVRSTTGHVSLGDRVPPTVVHEPVITCIDARVTAVPNAWMSTDVNPTELGRSIS